MSRFNNKNVIITGGTSGIGLATAIYLQSQGARVAVTGRDPKVIDAARSALGEKALILRSDTSKVAEITALAAKIKDSFGQLDLLFINAGIAKFIPLEAITEEAYDEMMNINLRGAFFTAQKFAPLLRAGSSIVLTTSVVDELGMATSSVYAASKAGLRSLARTLSAELLPHGVRVNAVSPGPITTPLYGKLGMTEEQVTGWATQMREGNPMKRFGTPEEVAAAVAYLAFDATYTSGAELTVDGGMVQM